MSADRFAIGDRVRVLAAVEHGNPRTPGYVRQKTGIVTASYGVIENPQDHHQAYPPLYTVAFRVQDLSGAPGPDLVTADLHEEWLEPA